MSRFYRFRQLCRITGILSGVVALVGIMLSVSAHTFWGYLLIACGALALFIDIIIIAIKNRCLFCNKALRIAPVKGEEFCPYCGCKID